MNQDLLIISTRGSCLLLKTEHGGETGLLLGSLLVATGLAIFQSNAGGAWDNCKEYISEQGFLGQVMKTESS